jgi:hypothetical protein
MLAIVCAVAIYVLALLLRSSLPIFLAPSASPNSKFKSDAASDKINAVGVRNSYKCNTSSACCSCLQVPGVKVTCVESRLLTNTAIERREMSINVDGHTEPFKCIHYHMLCWPDHGAPRETGTVREIARAVRSVRSTKCN